MKLLGIDANPKLMKEKTVDFADISDQLNEKWELLRELYKGTITGGVSLAPNDQNGLGVDLCGGNSTPFCRNDCLFIQGRGRMDSVSSARIKKAQYFIKENKKFVAQLVSELNAMERRATKLKLKPCVRLNVITDIKWENIKYKGSTLFELFPNIEFYDYTKNWKRDVSHIPNYTLTYSKKETINNKRIPNMTDKNKNVAVIFRHSIPDTFEGTKVINGDVHDLRFLDTTGVIVGLTAKGTLKKANAENYVFD